MPRLIEFESLSSADLIIDAIYQGKDSQLASDPISRLPPGCGNMGGFRMAGKGRDKLFVALFTTGQEKDWPDRIDLNTGQFTYYGDNRTPGHELHDTPLGGNRALRRVFDLIHSLPPQRELIPPFFVFQKYATQKSARAVQFKGLAIPGHPSLSATEDLVAVWKTSGGQRFQNYRSVFTILDVAIIERPLLSGFISGSDTRVSQAPDIWKQWVLSGKYRPLT
jgi:Restriction endonuclease AspBHI N-terminal